MAKPFRFRPIVDVAGGYEMVDPAGQYLGLIRRVAAGWAAYRFADLGVWRTLHLAAEVILSAAERDGR